ncbi:MAG TPA: histidine kinase [Caulobacteraceae bacterium]|jgi:two-component system sensor histidine kinase UhpB|nr:histidine kinase [Caulobacteraceae bacterium]
MSLRLRVVIAIVLALVAGSAAAVGLAGLRARLSLAEELTAGLGGAGQAASGALTRLSPRNPDADLQRLVRSFDGDRHVRVVLLDGRSVEAASRPAAFNAAPAWFTAVLAPVVTSRTLPAPAPAGRSLRLEPAPAGDVAALWSEFVELSGALAVSIAVAGVIAWVTVGRALAPLSAFRAAFDAIGSGHYEARISHHGPRELAPLAAGLNEMAGRLAAMQARTAALERQLLTLQEEERADIARDLHDDVGPHLFAVSVDTAMARRHVEAGKSGEAIDRLEAAQTAIGAIQRMVREILARLRPTELIEFGLAAAIDELVSFWQSRRPGIAFQIQAPKDDTTIDPAVREAVYRFVQEGLSNAVRHGRPQRIEISVTLSPHAVEALVFDDGDTGGQPPREGLGLRGMRERLAAVGGRLEIERSGGWRLAAHIPLIAMRGAA